MTDTSIKSLPKSLDELYQSGDYRELINTVIKNKMEYPKGQYHHVLGSIFGKSENFPAARYHLELANKHGFLTSESKSNLLSVKSNIDLSQDVSTSRDFETQLINTTTSIPIDYYLLVSGALFLGVALLFSMKKIKKFLALALVMVSITPVLIKLFLLNDYSFAISLNESILREGPNEIFEEVYKVPAGVKVILGKRDGKWVYVDRPLSLAGWVKISDFGLL